MAVHDLHPAFVKINYHSEFAPHVMTLQTRQWLPLTGIPAGQFQAWDLSYRQADLMVEQLIDLVKVVYNDDVVFDGYTIYNFPAGDEHPSPVFIKHISVAGTGTFSGWNEAVQVTIVMYTDDFNFKKFVMLDRHTDNDFSKFYVASADDQAIIDDLALSTNGWAGRDDHQITGMKSITITLNERLRREYHLR